MNAYAIILAGGNGERFWPISTPERPKQFVDIFGGKPLIRHAVDRLGRMIPPERILVITAAHLVAETRAALPMVPKANIIGEPCRRNTAAAMAVACAWVKRLGGADAVGCVLTADHLIKPATKFRRELRVAIMTAARADSIVTIGISPSYAATGFGYIEEARQLPAVKGVNLSEVRRFVEKPDLKTAEHYLASGRFLWNSGMFIWRQATLEREFSKVSAAWGKLISEVAAAKSIEKVLARRYPRLKAISFDYAVMEHARNILVVRGDFDWDDVGSWNAIARHFSQDRRGNVMLGKVAMHDCGNTTAVALDGHLVATVGLRDLVVVHTRAATLVCAKGHAQEIRKLLAKLGKVGGGKRS